MKYFYVPITAVLLTLFFASCKYPTGDNKDSTSGSGGETRTNCLGFFACGGDVAGTWTVDTMCLEGDLNAELSSEVNLPADCTGFFQEATASTKGTLTYSNDNESAKLTVTITATVEYTETCLSALVGQATFMDVSSCDDMQDELANRTNVDAVKCSLVGTTCSCSLSEKRVIDTLVGYAVDDNSLVYITGDSTDYCVSNSTLTVRKPGLVGSLSGTINAHR